MRIQLVALMTALALLPAAQAQEAQDPIVHDVRLMLGDAEISSIDIIDDHAKAFTYEVDVEDPDFGGEILLVELVVHLPNGALTLRPTLAERDGDIETWSGSHPVDDVRLVVGTHPAELRVFDRNGGQTFCAIEGNQGSCFNGPDVDSLGVTWTSQSSYQLGLDLLDADADETQVLGPGGKIRLDVGVSSATQDAPWALQHVRFVNEYGEFTTAAKSLRVPYVIGPQDLQQGMQALTITATDRAGRAVSLEVDADVDTKAPLVDVALPALTYQGVPFDVRVQVDDANDYTATAILDDVRINQTGGPGVGLVPFTFERDLLGNGSLLVRVVDVYGNQFLRQVNVTTVEARTDSTVRVEVTPSHPLPQENVTVRFTAQQQSGVATLPFNLTLTVDGLGVVCCDEGVDVPLNVPYEYAFSRFYLPGQYAFNATIAPVPGVNETDDSDQTDVGFFEVFMGKVVYNDETYFMRLGDGGIEPSHAVSPGGSLYDVTAREQNGGTVFAFTAKGVDLYWDPLMRVTDLTPEETEPGEESPGVPVALVLLLVGMLAWARRR
ncbi:MAG: hypothetical protein ACPHID_00065 [Thermoplasmatota archaeon]